MTDCGFADLVVPTDAILCWFQQQVVVVVVAYIHGDLTSVVVCTWVFGMHRQASDHIPWHYALGPWKVNAVNAVRIENVDEGMLLDVVARESLVKYIVAMNAVEIRGTDEKPVVVVPTFVVDAVENNRMVLEEHYQEDILFQFGEVA